MQFKIISALLIHEALEDFEVPIADPQEEIWETIPPEILSPPPKLKVGDHVHDTKNPGISGTVSQIYPIQGRLFAVLKDPSNLLIEQVAANPGGNWDHRDIENLELKTLSRER